ALENGKIYCVDAHGDEATGAPPQVYWTYPTEDPTNDPNNSPAEDGKDNIAEPPYAFDLTSALVANVGGEDLLYIASRNGKIYCLEMTGRGDGTTRRRWTYPDDYDPTLPSLPMKTGFRPILGSLAFGTALGTPMIIVGTQEGRIIALNAAGNATQKTTSVVWQYPPLISAVSGPIEMTPVVAFGRVYYGTTPTPTSTAGRIVGLDLGTGFPVFQQDGATIGGFAKFGAASPVAVPGTMLANGGANWDKTINDFGNDRLFVCDSAGKFASLNVLTGAIIWSTTELTVGAAGPLRFSFTTMPDNTSVLEQDVPLVYVPDFGGRINGMNARGNRNRKSTTRVWSAKLAGDNQIATLATGGYSPPSGNPHSWLYTGDTLGNLYAFNSVNDTQVQPILPGIPPIVDIIDDKDSSIYELNNAIDTSKFKLISPEQYDRLRELSDNNGGIITSQIVQDIANNHSIDRRYYDFGETLYILIYDLPNGTGPNAGYYVDFEISSAGRSPQHRPQPLRSYTVGNGNYVIAGLPLMTNGVGGVGPGPNFLTAKAVAPGNRNLQGTEYHLPKPASWVVTPDGDAVDFYIANPLSLAFTGDDGRTVTESVTLNNLTNPLYKIQTDYAANQNRWLIFNRNGNDRIDQGTGGVTEPRGPLGPDLVSKGQAVSHGNPGVQQLQVADRSLMTLVMGRGMAGVRVGPRDIAWVKAVGDPTGGIYKPLSTNVNYPGFEDFPINVPNTSQDYPDVARDRMSITSNLLGQAQNPLYVSGVDLEGPGFSTAQLQTYRVKAGYEAQMDRQINLTTFDVSLAVPKYQPPSQQGYYGSQLVFVDYQNGNPNFDPTQSSFRTFGLGLGVAVDEHLVFQTPTVDLASLPSGGGFNGGPGNGPLNPWDPATFFSPWDTNFNNLFQPFTVYNEGNVNILNLRMAKYFHDTNGNRPVELFMPGQQELAWLDASLHMHTSIDPRFSASLRVGPGQIGYDAQGRNILQKPRPLDLTGTRYNVNPKSRPNSGLRIVGSYLYNQAVVPPGDAKIGVSAPIGSPAGEYIRRIFAFENNDTTNDPNPQNPSLGTQEPYTDPGLNLKFIVRESRVTNAPTQKSAPLVENIMSPADVFGWSNTQPTSMRDGLGNIFTAWSSDRVDTNNNAAWVPKQRLEGDLLIPSKWRVYVASLRSILGNVLGESPIGELNAWSADTANRWFRQVLVVDPLGTMANPFNLGPGETLDAASVKFGAPVFPTGGFFNQLDDPAQSGRQWFTGRFMTFIGEATKFDAAGNATQVNMIFAAPMVFNADGSITFDPGDMVSSPYDVTSKKSRPALTLQRTGSRDALTIYTSSVSNGNGQITWHRYNSAVPPDQRWSLGSVRLGRSFEQVGAPSVSLHRYRNGTDGQHPYNQAYVTFSGKVKGRRFSDVYQLRLRVDSNGWPSGRNPVMPYGNLTGNGQPNPDVPFIDELTLDPSTGTYWAPGLQWITNNQTILDRIDIGTSSAYNTGNYRFTNSIWDNNVQTRDFDSRNGILKFNSTKGGEVVIDTVTGSVRFNGAILTRGTRLFINYRPTLIRLADGAGSNYRSVASAYDDRFIGIRVDQANPQRNLIGDLLYWLNSANNQAGVNDPLRWDRTVIAYTRTSGDGTASTRPFYQTFRFGVKLQNGIQTDVNGRPTNFSVTFGGGNAGEQFCQIDPASGRVFFMSGYEDRVVTVSYNAVDEAGRLIGQRTEELLVRVIPEIDEQALPIEQVGNESALSISLDPLNGTFNDISPVTGRRPGLIWLFWTSTRNGQPDIFFETIAPRFSPRRAEQ
ncbi:MAG: PQQ-binding-like beta-propeller repeat protein, partial [Chthonomonadaceae bacterium]|nr:PQQ-binding-like beta-propeller repeat protein [Chthonomonadaceae bacterium]